ncbi:hypothetical protein Flexsi_1786 [Flexistipes sinusarabici DSM 4947]|uniref:Uncharacterized protein n=1 Tax=Flexistipes sinusarabici (strain ATCC 49648 / DSM 4947 / MAS 10) TaxID=717231 RepID=F8EA13_FLESM|nr:hypothetical protein [Flexistipes sinusarabici]AEI15424.1 hypothetical protein Flexsi_1786 [Flexistipes sinusarabici DSM 4947]
MIHKIYNIISFYDEIRWSSLSNYNLINFCNEDLDDDAKLLTHWLCYITDRQTSFQRIWDVGGFVLSDLVEQIKKTRSLDALNPESENSFVCKNGNEGFSFISKSKANGNTLLQDYYSYKADERIKFTPRYYPSDYFSIIYTFSILKNYDFSFTKFIIEQFEKHKNSENYIKKILYSLYLLTYFEVGQPNKKDMSDFYSSIKNAESRANKVYDILSNNFQKNYAKFAKRDIFNQKRAWCSLRDFLKSPEFKKYFIHSLENEGISAVSIKKLTSLESLRQLELPGDVWNNNPIFRSCIFQNTEYEESKKSLNVILRDYFDKNKSELDESYPEQFDVTFDFVPRMCSMKKCNICPINVLKTGEYGDFFKTCVRNKDLFCTVALINCGYNYNCIGEQCKLLKILP